VAGSLNGDSKLRSWIWVGVFKGSALLMWLQPKRCIWKVAMKGDNRRKSGGSGSSSASPDSWLFVMKRDESEVQQPGNTVSQLLWKLTRYLPHEKAVLVRSSKINDAD
jgi:hypothetical protein